jgi:excisionase family DNA binding protein
VSDDRLLTIADLQMRLQCSRSTVYELLSPKGDLPVVRLGSRGIRCLESTLVAWMKQRERATVSAAPGEPSTTQLREAS